MTNKIIKEAQSVTNLESMDVIAKTPKKIIVQGLLLPKDKVSRNGVLYDWESITQNVNKLAGLPMLYNHLNESDEKPIGKFTKSWLKEQDDDEGSAGWYYEADINPSSKYADSILRGDLSKVSIQVIANDQKTEESADGEGSFVRAFINDVIEASVVPTPGFMDTNINVVYAESFKVGNKESWDDYHKRIDGLVSQGKTYDQILSVMYDEFGNYFDDSTELKNEIRTKLKNKKENVRFDKLSAYLYSKPYAELGPSQQTKVVKLINQEPSLEHVEEFDEKKKLEDMTTGNNAGASQVMMKKKKEASYGGPECPKCDDGTQMKKVDVAHRGSDRSSAEYECPKCGFMEPGYGFGRESFNEALKIGDKVHSPSGYGKIISITGNKVIVRSNDPAGDFEYDLNQVQKESLNEKLRIGDFTHVDGKAVQVTDFIVDSTKKSATYWGLDDNRNTVNWQGKYEEASTSVTNPTEPKDVDPNELEMGLIVEMEHTDDKKLAMKIALDHLAEIPDYYTRLKQMEDDAGVNMLVEMASEEDCKELLREFNPDQHNHQDKDDLNPSEINENVIPNTPKKEDIIPKKENIISDINVQIKEKNLNISDTNTNNKKEIVKEQSKRKSYIIESLSNGRTRIIEDDS